MTKLNLLVNELQDHVHHHQLINLHISKGSVGWHIEHCLLTINHIIDALETSNPQDYKPKTDYRRMLVMFFGIIPRGKVRAPKKVQPTLTIDGSSLGNHFTNTRKNLVRLNQLNAQKYFTHPFLGDFKLKPALKFISIHTNHHLKIIKDIINKN